VKFQVAALAQAVQDALAADHSRWLADQEQAAQKVEVDRAEWVERWSAEWLDAVTGIRKLLRTGRPIERHHVPNDCGGRPAFYMPPRVEREDPKPYAAPVELLALKQVLATVADDFVTTAGLRELGISSGTMRLAVTRMAKGTTHS
jgi:hypothetical protein